MRGTRRRAIFLACIVGGLSAAEGAASEYLLQPGDVLSISVVGAPDLTRSVPVEMDGSAWVPLIGEVAAAGSSLRDVRRRVAQAYSVTPLDPPAAGAGGAIPARMNQVSVSIGEYRPVYVTGAVLSPRAVEFRPGLTVQQAITLANAGDGQRSPYAVREAVEAATIDLSRINARIWSLKKLLGTDTPEDHRAILVDHSDAVREIADLEEAMVAAMAAERERERRAIGEQIGRAEARLEALERQKANEEEGARLDEAVAGQVRKLFGRGSPLAPASRMAEAQRSALVSASRVLQIEVAAENVRTELSELRMRAEAEEGGAMSEILAQLSDALAQARLKNATLAAARSAAAAAPAEDEVLVIINRSGEILPPARASDMHEALQPGDILQVVIARPGRS